ncbi:MAG: biotin/lipoyl-containing protein [Thermodesulfobacteriota bacterium]
MTRYAFTINEQAFDVEIISIQGNQARVIVNRVAYDVTLAAGGQAATPARFQSAPASPPRLQPAAAPAPVMAPPPAAAPVSAAKPQTTGAAAQGAGTVAAQLPGKIIQIMVSVGDSVSKGQVLAVMEAMKMENNILSPLDGTVKEIRVSKDADVATGDVLILIA